MNVKIILQVAYTSAFRPSFCSFARVFKYFSTHTGPITLPLRKRGVIKLLLRTVQHKNKNSPSKYQTHTRGTPRTHACMCTHTRATFLPESKSDLGTILRDRSAQTRVSHAPSARVRLAYTVYARSRTRLSACTCADDRTYVPLPRANALGNYNHRVLVKC